MALKNVNRKGIMKPIMARDEKNQKNTLIKKDISSTENIQSIYKVTNNLTKSIDSKFEIDKDYVYLIEQNGNRKKISNYMELENIIRNIDTNLYEANIKYKGFGEYNNIKVKREDYLNRNKLRKLANKGLDVHDTNVNDLLSYFSESESEIKNIINVHSKIGFSKYKNKDVYKLYKALGIESTYVGGYTLEPKGEKSIYENMLEREVYGNTALELIIAVSFSSVIIGYIGEDLALDTNIFHIVGNSSIGKSTALKLAISLFGYPDNKKDGLYSNYNATDNAILKKLCGDIGVPFAIDEISMSKTENFTEFIYALANGVDKDRLNKELELKEKGNWLTTILSNGEKSLIDSSNKNAGIHVRVIEAKNISWTKNSQNSENINRIIVENYGHIGIEFAEYVIKMGKEEVKKDFDKVKEEIYKEINSRIVIDKMIYRRCSKYASIILSAYYYQDMKNINLDIDGMIDILVKIEEESIKNRNFSKSAIDYIKQYVSNYRNKFEGLRTKNQSEVMGKIISKNNYIEVQMNKISFEKMIKQGGYEDKNVVLKELKDNRLLNCEKDRFTRSRKNDLGYQEDFYVVKLPKETIE